jgi:hypothetical protein
MALSGTVTESGPSAGLRAIVTPEQFGSADTPSPILETAQSMS